MDISVVIPTYNDEKFIRISVTSVVEQTYEPLEVIVVNDGSTDNTPSVLNELSEEYPKLVVLNQGNRGAAAARNHGIRRARGDWIAFMDADDISKGYRFERQVARLKADPTLTVVGSAIDWVDTCGNTIQEPTSVSVSAYQMSWTLLFKNRMPQPTWVAKTVALRDSGGYKEHLQTISEDYDLISRLNRSHKVASINEALVSVRQHPGRTTYNFQKSQQKMAHEIGCREHKLLLGTGYVHSKSEQLLSGSKIYDVHYLLNLLRTFEKRKKACHSSRLMLRSHVAKKIWSDGRVLVRRGEEHAAREYFAVCKEEFGREAIHGSLIYKVIERLAGGIWAEKGLEVVKQLKR